MELRDVLKIHGKLRRYCTWVLSVARHERCNTFSTHLVFLIHLEIPCGIYIIFLFKIYTYCCVFCYTSSQVRCIFQYIHLWMYFFSKFLHWEGIAPLVSRYAQHSRCNTSSTCRVFLIHLSIPCCIYLLHRKFHYKTSI